MNAQERLEKFLKDRDAALMSLDMEYAEEVMPELSYEVRLIAMHKARYECTSIPDSYRISSYHWLKDSGYTRYGGLPFLPEGELPK